MLTQICAEIKNYFCKKEDILIGDFEIVNGDIIPPVSLQDGQYFRIVGSAFNDGVYGSSDILKDEAKFHGAVWKMRVPPDVIKLAEDIEEWQKKYGDVENPNMSPYSSESFGGYSYSKAQGYASTNGGMLNTWQNVFENRLSKYRKMRTL